MILDIKYLFVGNIFTRLKDIFQNSRYKIFYFYNLMFSSVSFIYMDWTRWYHSARLDNFFCRTLPVIFKHKAFTNSELENMPQYIPIFVKHYQISIILKHKSRSHVCCVRMPFSDIIGIVNDCVSICLKYEISREGILKRCPIGISSPFLNT